MDGPSTFTGAAKIEMLTVGRCAPPVTKPCRYRFGMDGIGQTPERSTEGVLAHVPGLHPYQGSAGRDAAESRHAGQAELGGFSNQSNEKRPSHAGRQPR